MFFWTRGEHVADTWQYWQLFKTSGLHIRQRPLREMLCCPCLRPAPRTRCVQTQVELPISLVMSDSFGSEKR